MSPSLRALAGVVGALLATGCITSDVVGFTVGDAGPPDASYVIGDTGFGTSFDANFASPDASSFDADDPVLDAGFVGPDAGLVGPDAGLVAPDAGLVGPDAGLPPDAGFGAPRG